MTDGQKRIERLAESQVIEPKDLYKFIVSDLEWLLLGITKQQYDDLVTMLNGFNKNQIGLWLKK
jgi:hypothetical protein